MKSANTLGIMQGRLSPPPDGVIQCFPRDTWAEEIALAPLAHLQSIEWIYDKHGDGANPIETLPGIQRVRQLCAQHGIIVESICADWFMEERLIGATSRDRKAAEQRLRWLLGQAQALGANRVVLPFVDASALTTAELLTQALDAILSILPVAHEASVELHLETSLGPDEFAAFLERVPDPSVRVNYDIGNSSGIGFDPHQELAAYGQRVGSVHIKDRQRGGTTVALGTGDADFEAVFSELQRLRYQGPFILQAARGTTGDELTLARANVEFASKLIGGLNS